MTEAQCKAMAAVLRAASEDGEAGARAMVQHELGGPSLAAYRAQASICNALADAYEAAAKQAPR